MSTVQTKDELQQRILELAKPHLPDAPEPILLQFIQQFFAKQPLESMAKLSAHTHAQTVTELWQFNQQRPFGKPKIKVRLWRPEIAGSASDRIIIEMINDDMSFLVSSLMALLTRLNLTPRLMLHPILHVRRDKSGQFLTLENRYLTGSDIRDESFIRCEIIESVTPEVVESLQQQLPLMLKEVRLANQDWQMMAERIPVAIADLEEAKNCGITGHNDEIEKFLQWMKGDHFTFLGYCRYDLVNAQGRLLREPHAAEALGILSEEALQDLKNLFKGIDYNGTTRRLIMRSTPFLINKASRVSHVHRPVLMDTIGIKRFNKQGKPIGIHLFLGLFTSTAYDSSARDIPYLRQKIDEVVVESGLSTGWHDGKALVHILDSLPRDELFQASVTELKTIGMQVLQLQEFKRVALFVRMDSFKRFLSCLVYIPEDRFNSELVDKIGAILAEEFQGELGSVKAQFGSLAVARVHYIIRIQDTPANIDDLKPVEAKLMEAARSWRDELRIGLNEQFSEWKSASLFKHYRTAFSKGYQERFLGSEVIQDIEKCEKVYESLEIQARVYAAADNQTDAFKLKIFHPHGPLALSDILPSLENLDLRVMSEMSFKISPENTPFPIWVHEFELSSRGSCPIQLIEHGERFLETLHRAYNRQIENDGFNRLVLRAGLSWREAELIRAYFRYLKQLNIPFGEATIQNALVSNPKIVQKLVQLFYARFQPGSAFVTGVVEQELLSLLQDVDISDDDRILRRYHNLIMATLRTNFFQKDKEGHCKPCISLKFDCALIDEIPQPRPMYEIFVYSPRVEAVHLRGGKVARGGIRWSDRADDFRTEILGLLKAQMVKNVVIVPVGSKGGFIVKSSLSPKASRDEIFAEGVMCYKTMIGGMLDITDNMVDNAIVKPANTICYDGDDPYLVVAADKGTATFSDFANSVSQEYGFWLDDAFASGGSAGYDHKKMGITARGAWESVKQHFRTLGIDVQKDVIRVIGVGDMAGDVFGNGMLLSDKIQLVGAFNHQHIFIDPHPDPAKSFQERQRLFNLPRSTWKDYNSEILSTGGQIIERSAKSVQLTPQVQEMLKCTKSTLTPIELIKRLLTQDVDLLWFGGIGTFVKASSESHADAGDRANDSLRVNGRDLRCKVVGEGANLGVTHLGRIEYSQKAKGRINTDAIDNSAGVDTSDHEVNIKILLRQIMAQQQLTREERNTLLSEMTDSVAKLVLRDNYLQNLCINLIEWEGATHLDSDIRLIRTLEKKGKLNRALEFLPDDAQLAEYQAAQMGLSRPEIAVLMAYAKINLFEEILETDLPDEAWLEDILIHYFPGLLRRMYPDAILKHPLRREIIATCIVNQIINRTGSSFIYDLQDLTGASFSDVLRAFLIVIHVFSFEKLWAEIETYDFQIEQEKQIQLYYDLLRILKRAVSWTLRNMHQYGDLNTLATKLAEGVDFFILGLHDCLDASAEERLATIMANYFELNIERGFAERLAILTIAASSPDILLIADKTGLSIKEVAKLYYLVASRFQITRLHQELREIVQITQWGRLTLNGLHEDLYLYHNDLVTRILESAQFTLDHCHIPQELLNTWITHHQKAVDKYDAIMAEAMAAPVKELAIYMTLIRELKNL